MPNIPDHPAIRHAETYGYGDPVRDAEYECPHCGADLYPDDAIYQNGGETVGCKFCFDEDEWDIDEIEQRDAEDMYG